MPKMTHEDATGRGKTIDVKPDMVPMYETQGWQKVTASSSTSKSSTDSK